MSSESVSREAPRRQATKARASGVFLPLSALLVPLLFPSLASALPNLIPYQPAGWTSKIVISNVTGSTDSNAVDVSPLKPTDTLFVNWAVINSGDAPAAVRFFTDLYVDGVLRQSWYSDPPLNPDYYANVEDYSIGSLPVGTHTIRIKTDSTGVIGESNESDNEYTKTITVGASGGCTADARTLCLNSGRFKAQVAWQALHLGTSGTGQAVPLTSDTGYFWFFSDTNVELVIKVVDGTTLNGQFWVFYGALSNVQYTITVTDTATGRSKTYFNPQDTLASVADTSAFSGSFTAPIDSDAILIPASPAGALLASAPPRIEPAAVVQLNASCAVDATTLCLNSGRFRVQVAWQAIHLGTGGAGQAVPLTSDTGHFWFFSRSNVELVVKVVDGTSVNGDFWVFYGALSNVQYTMTVTDTTTGVSKTYFNPQDMLASAADTSAFQSPPVGRGPLAFGAPTALEDATVGVPYFFSFCAPTPIGSSLCGALPGTTNPVGGNPPYHFQLDSGVGFPPFGISLNSNGTLSGTPSIQGPPRPFSVCAVDLSAASVCRVVSLRVVTAPPTVSFTANPSTVAPGQSFTLTWATTNATSVSIGGVAEPVSGSFSTSFPTAGTYTYTLTATGPGGTTTAKVTVTVSGGGGGGTGYTYANWNCNNQSQCISVVGHNTGSAGPFCSPTACNAWRISNFNGATCTAQPSYTIYSAPAPGSCFN